MLAAQSVEDAYASRMHLAAVLMSHKFRTAAVIVATSSCRAHRADP